MSAAAPAPAPVTGSRLPHVLTCRACRRPMRRNGRLATGVQRYRCPECGREEQAGARTMTEDGPIRAIMPWMEQPLDEWDIIGMNHYHVKGRRFLFVAMVNGDKCIKAEGEDERRVFEELRRKAIDHGR